MKLLLYLMIILVLASFVSAAYIHLSVADSQLLEAGQLYFESALPPTRFTDINVYADSPATYVNQACDYPNSCESGDRSFGYIGYNTSDISDTATIRSAYWMGHTSFIRFNIILLYKEER